MDTEIHRITKDSPVWLHRAYEYARTDAFCFGQGIPINFEYGHEELITDDYKAVVIIDDGKPVAGCRISFPRNDIGKIGRVCVVRNYQKKGVGKKLIEAAEEWILESNVTKIVINSQDRAQGFYEKLGYELVQGVDPRIYEESGRNLEEITRNYIPQKNKLGFSCVLVEKHVS
ncbi:GNAT family N-acetyltransferase [Butyrivibrio sp. VCB2006]|uniref:GNAT family N-acetyltransferase n=1 Tax=Butyrivibrio sp. VCB2006 TaxID=1280679 RepID=UPI00040EC3AE|nr:GNAT family N-acetyltransferase [Butyrivibrio sp. VCB2006]